MQYSLLEIVQQILGAIDGDEVNSIDDTVEANQIAILLRGVYYDIASDISLPQLDTLLEINASTDPDKPCLMTVPSTVVHIDWIKYDNRADGDTNPLYKDVKFLPIRDFIEKTQALQDETNTDVQTITFNGEQHDFIYRTDKFPEYFTVVDDYQVLFDSYDSSIDTTLMKSKTMCFGQTFPVFSLTDDFVPELSPQQYSYFINKAKVRAFAELKQASNQEAASEARRQKVILQKKKRVTPDMSEFDILPKYGRK